MAAWWRVVSRGVFRCELFRLYASVRVECASLRWSGSVSSAYVLKGAGF